MNGTLRIFHQADLEETLSEEVSAQWMPAMADGHRYFHIVCGKVEILLDKENAMLLADNLKGGLK